MALNRYEMNRVTYCLECGDEDQTPVKLYEDPRIPPLDTVPCLCKDCYIMTLEDCLEYAEADAALFTRMLSEVRGKQ